MRRWVEAQLYKLVDHVVDVCEGSDDVDRAARAEREEMQEAMRAMGWAEGGLPLSFGGGGAALQRPLMARGQEQEEGDGEWAPAVGEECECLYEEDGGWYPARVEALLLANGDNGEEETEEEEQQKEGEGEGEGMATVTYLGYGETRVVPCSHLRRPRQQGGGEQRRSSSSARPSFFSADGRDEEPPPHAHQPAAQAGVPRKYWMQRFRLFSQFDRGVRLDPEGWFSVTPERVAAHIAERSRCDVVVDLFAGCGGNVIQFAKACHRVVAIDLVPTRLAHARHNAAVYGVGARIEFVLGDALALLPALQGRVDVLFMSPPWGGPEYLDQPGPYKLDQIQIPRLSSSSGEGSSEGSGAAAAAAAAAAGPPAVGGRELLARVLAVCPNVAVLLPRTVDLRELAEVAGGRPLEVEENVLNYKLKTITAYFGSYFLPAPPPDFVDKKRRREKQQQQQQVGGGEGQQGQQPPRKKKRRNRGGRKRGKQNGRDAAAPRGK